VPHGRVFIFVGDVHVADAVVDQVGPPNLIYALQQPSCLRKSAKKGLKPMKGSKMLWLRSQLVNFNHGNARSILLSFYTPKGGGREWCHSGQKRGLQPLLH